MNIITVGYHTEGTTDERFLQSVIKRTFDSVAFECESEIEVYEPEVIDAKGDTYIEEVIQASRIAASQGALVLCVHVDADDQTDHDAFKFKINPAVNAAMNAQPIGCKALVAVVPVRMIESWMLADIELLKNEIGTSVSNHDLELDRHPEAYSDPKAAIENAIRIAFSDRPKRHRNQLDINELYIPIGRKIGLDKLSALPSYIKFREGVKNAFIKLNFLYS